MLGTQTKKLWEWIELKIILVFWSKTGLKCRKDPQRRRKWSKVLSNCQKHRKFSKIWSISCRKHRKTLENIELSPKTDRKRQKKTQKSENGRTLVKNIEKNPQNSIRKAQIFSSPDSPIMKHPGTVVNCSQ